jgi:hypothetical protein
MYRSNACSVRPVGATGRHGHWDTQIDLLVLWRLSEAFCHGLLGCTSAHQTRYTHNRSTRTVEVSEAAGRCCDSAPPAREATCPFFASVGSAGHSQTDTADVHGLGTSHHSGAGLGRRTRRRPFVRIPLASPAPSCCTVIVVFRSTGDGVLERRCSFSLIARSCHHCL